jgi:hypothetical protein
MLVATGGWLLESEEHQTLTLAPSAALGGGLLHAVPCALPGKLARAAVLRGGRLQSNQRCVTELMVSIIPPCTA